MYNKSTINFKDFKPIKYVGEGSTHLTAWILLSVIWLAFIPIGIIQHINGLIIFGIVACTISYFIGLIYTQVVVKQNPILLEKARIREVGVLRVGKVINVVEDWKLCAPIVVMDLLSLIDHTRPTNPFIKHVYYIIEYENLNGQKILLRTARIRPKGNLGRYGTKSLDVFDVGKTVLLYEYQGKAFADMIERTKLV